MQIPDPVPIVIVGVATKSPRPWVAREIEASDTVNVAVRENGFQVASLLRPEWV